MTALTRTLICGLEVHAELKTKSKMFCSCVNDPFGAEKPNIHTCPVCLGMPGGLPVANKTAVMWTIKLGLALNCKINLFSKFDRKHYFYPDLAKGYQISQYDIPFCENGVLDTSFGPVRIRRIHLEEDTGKLLHTTVDGEAASLIDFNRSGVPLVEIVTEPDIHSPEQAKEYGKKLRQLLRYLDIADCDMEQGGMRLEANISMSDDPKVLPNYKVEVKNINSFRYMEQAISFEMQRQSLELDAGKTPKQETRGWDTKHNTTFPQRTKEDAEDYRYFPDPDLPPVRISNEQLEQIKVGLPLLPEKVVTNWQTEFEIDPRFGESLADSQAAVAWYTKLFAAAKTAKQTPNQLANDIVNGKVATPKLTESAIADTLKASATLHQVESIDEAELTQAISQVLEKFPAEVSRYKAGETQLFNFFIGQIMRTLGKKVAIDTVRQATETALKS